MTKAEAVGLEQYCSLPPEEVLKTLGSRLDGLSDEEAQTRFVSYGPNEIREIRGKSLTQRFAVNLTHPMAILLWAASVMAYVGKMPQLAAAIIGVVMINAVFSFWQEYRAERTTKELKKLIPQYARVIRSGVEKLIPAREVVRGDITVLSEGDRIPADGRVIKNFDIMTDESALTGESRVVSKISQQIALKTARAPHGLPNLVFGGTNVASGSGIAAVFATGMDMQFGKIAHLTETVEEEPSPLQKELKRVTGIVTLLAILVGVVVFVAALSLGVTAVESFLFAIGMIVAFVPEGLLPTVTLSLAISMQRMAQRRAVIKKLSSVETLGCTTVICTDKTGTLTCNEMTVTRIWVNGLDVKVTGTGYNPVGSFVSNTIKGQVEDDPDLQELLTAAITCNNARLIPPTDQQRKWNILGDPTEAALLVAALKAGMSYPSRSDRVALLPFDSKRKRMSVVVNKNHGESLSRNGGLTLKAYVKGAPAELLDLCVTILKDGKVVPLQDSDRATVRQQIDTYARDGLRVLGIAVRDLADTPRLSSDVVETEMTFVGLTAMMDPPRPEVEEAIRKCNDAGIRVLMLTGDYGLTADFIARRLGIISGRARIITGEEIDSISDETLQDALRQENIIFARISPEHKLRIVVGLQALNNIVAMTGDGVNDAPALKKADIGVAMGVSGTDVAKEAADMIITDDNFASIVSAVEEGRAVYNNIKKFTKYVFASNVPEAVPFILYVLARIPLPLTVMQILSVDLGTDMVPAIALGAEPPEDDVMRFPPRRRGQGILSIGLLAHSLLFLGGIEALAAMTSYYWINSINGYGPSSLAQPGTAVYAMATTMTLVGIVMSQVGNVFACRTERSSTLKRNITINPLLPMGLVFEISIILVLVYVPFLHPIFGTAPLLPQHWLFPLIFAPIILLADEVRKLLLRRSGHMVSTLLGGKPG